MKWTGLIGIIAALLFPATVASADTPRPTPQVGDVYELTMIRETVSTSSNRSSGRSHTRNAMVERVIELRADGLVLEYDLPNDVTADVRARNWQFPIRVFKPFRGPVQLLNVPEIEARIDRWLKAGGIPRSACGHWIFTWNAFRIECDPQSVISTVGLVDLNFVDLREGAPYGETGAHGTGTLTRKSSGPDGAVFTVELPVDPDAVRRARAESDVAVGEIMRKPVTLDEAIRNRARDTVSGTVSVTFETDSTGSVRRRTRVTTLDIKGSDGRSGAETITETLDRRRISRRD
jgi:hypothetical protein